MNTKKKRGLTIIEVLIVVNLITILSGISFFMIGGYNSTSRDAKRINEIAIFKSGIEIHHSQSGLYPMPDNPKSVLSGEDKGNFEGTLGKLVSEVSGVSEHIVDPLTYNPYYYATSGNQKEYQILYELEEDSKYSFIETVNAYNKMYVNVSGNYNGDYAITDNGNIITLPSLFTLSDESINISEPIDFILDKGVIVRNYSNINISEPIDFILDKGVIVRNYSPSFILISSNISENNEYRKEYDKYISENPLEELEIDESFKGISIINGDNSIFKSTEDSSSSGNPNAGPGNNSGNGNTNPGEQGQESSGNPNAGPGNNSGNGKDTFGK